MFTFIPTSDIKYTYCSTNVNQTVYEYATIVDVDTYSTFIIVEFNHNLAISNYEFDS